MNVLSMQKRSYVDDVTDHKGRVNGSEGTSLPGLLMLRCSVVQNGCSTKKKKKKKIKKGRAGNRRAAAPPTVNGDDFIGKLMG